MTSNHPYDPISQIRYQMSVLSLAAALDQKSPDGTSEFSQGALLEAEQLKELMDRQTQ